MREHRPVRRELGDLLAQRPRHLMGVGVGVYAVQKLIQRRLVGKPRLDRTLEPAGDALHELVGWVGHRDRHGAAAQRPGGHGFDCDGAPCPGVRGGEQRDRPVAVLDQAYTQLASERPR